MKIDQTFPPTSPAQLDEFERDEGVQLPAEYREFLLTSNGGRPHANVDVPEFMEVVVNDFFGLQAGEEYDLRGERAMYEDRIPPGTIPIAGDPGGNLFLLSVDGDSKGAVYYWDHEEEPQDGGTDWSDFENVYRIAASFDEFLALLRPYRS
jgi:SMI1 / KNR4 family (SUKH-1)